MVLATKNDTTGGDRMVEVVRYERTQIQQLFAEKNAHVLYKYSETDSYLNQLSCYIDDAIKASEHVFLVENERNYRLIIRELNARYTETELKQIRYVNSINFYLSSGSYYPPAIEAYFADMVKPFVDNNISFRSWAHVEWESMKGPSHLIEVFEKIVDQAVNEIPFSLICAYDRNRMPYDLDEVLLKTHPYILEDDELIVSEKYVTELELNK